MVRIRSSLALLLWGTSVIAGALPDPIKARIEADYAAFAKAHPTLANPMDSSDFRHPAEIEMIETLMTRNPGIQDLVDAVKKDQLAVVRSKDQAYRLQAVEVGPGQLPEVHALAVAAARKLGLHEDFKVFVVNNAEMAEDVMGFPRHGHYGNSFGPFSILLTSGLVKAVSLPELGFVIAREMAHVKANHRFYTGLAFAWQQKHGKLPVLAPGEKAKKAPGVGGSMQLFFERGPFARRLSEFSADRGALVVAGDPQIGIGCLAKVARGDLAGTDGFDMASYLKQVEEAAAGLGPDEAAELAAKQGFVPYTLTRVRELVRFGGSQEYRRLVDRTGVNPFLLEAEILHRIGQGTVRAAARLAEYEKDPATARLDPLEAQATGGALRAALARHQAALDALTGLVVSHVELGGLEAANPMFGDLIETIRLKADVTAYMPAVSTLRAKIRFALSNPELTPEARAELDAKDEAIGAVWNLVPPKAKPAAKPASTWLEAQDLPGALNATVGALKGAASDKGAFLAKLDDLKPELRTRALAIVAKLGPDEKREMAELLRAHGGQLAKVVDDVLAAGTDEAALGALFDRWFDRSRFYLKLVPLAMIQRGLDKLSQFDL